MKLFETFFTIYSLIQSSFSLSLNSTYMNQYNTFVDKYQKDFSYENFEVFKKNVKYIEEFNQQDHSYQLEVNQFSDMDDFHLNMTLPKIDGEYYIDGAVRNQYPIDFCVEKGFNKDEILGIKIKDDKRKNNITEKDNLFTYSFYLVTSLIAEYRTKTDINLKNEIIIQTIQSNIETAMELVRNKEKRKEFLELGERYAKLFLSYLEKNNL